MSLLENHVVLITGAGSGLGLGLARHFLAEGAQLAVLEVSQPKVDSLHAEFGADVLVCQGDVTKLEDILACKEQIDRKFGRLDSLVAAHGIFDGMVRLKETPIERVSNLFDEVFHINVAGNVLLSRVFLEMLEESSGSIVMTSSSAAYAADGGGLMYTASKGAVRSMVNQLAYELCPKVRVNGVAPSGIANSQLRGPEALGMEKQLQSDIPKDIFLDGFKNLSLMEKLPTPEEYAPLYAFLASRANKIMTGQTIVADQGILNRSLLTEKNAC